MTVVLTPPDGVTSFLPNHSLGWNYNVELGYIVGGISRAILNSRDSGTFAGDASGFIANTFLESNPALSIAVYRHAPSATNGLGERISNAPAAVPAIAGALNLTGLLQNSNVAADAATGDLVVSLYAVVIAPSDAVVNSDGTIAGFKLLVEGAAVPLRVSLDQRASLSGAERLGLSQPWQELFNQWGSPKAASSAVLSGITPAQALPIQLDLLVPKGTDPAALGNIRLAYQLGNATPQSFGSINAPLLAWMPSSPIQRQEQGSSYQMGFTPSGTIGGSNTTVEPYISALLVNAAGSNFTDTDFVIEEGAAVVRGRLLAGVTGGQGITKVDIYDTGSSKAFADAAYRSLNASQLKARLAAGSDAQIFLQASNGSVTGVAVAKNGGGSGYLNGGSGRFRQWVAGTTSDANPARALLEISVNNGSVSALAIVAQEGRFADAQPASIALANNVAGNGSGLELLPLISTTLDTNLLDDSGVSIGSFQRYVNGGFRSEVDLVYTQGGADRSKPINSGLNLDTPLLVNRMQEGRGWVNIAIQDPVGAYTPGVDGFNFDSASNSLYFNKDTIGGKRSVLLFSHANLSAIKSERDLYLLEDALLQAQVYAALERKDQANNLFFSAPFLLSDPSKGGTNSNGVIEPFYAVRGAGIAPIFDDNRQLLATWVHTTSAGQAEIQMRIGSADGDPSTGSISWSPIRSIALPEKVSGNDVTDLSLTYLNGTTPVLSWSLNTLTPYQAGVLRSKPTAYYRLDDLPSQGTIASIGESSLSDGQLASGAESVLYSSWLDTASSPLSQADALSVAGALMPAERTAQQPGDPNAGLQFSGGGFVEVPNVFLSRLTGASNEQPSGYAADFWIKPDAPTAGSTDVVESLLDNGLYNPGAVLPGASELKLPVRLRRTATTETVEGVEQKGYRYSLVVAASTFANLGIDGGFGTGLSPFNLSFAVPKTSLNFTSAAASSKTIALEGTLLGDLAQYRTKQGKLSSFTLGENEVELNSFFEADNKSPGLEKVENVFNYDSQDLGIENQQITGWSVRKRLTNGQQFVDFNFGTNATLSAALPSSSDGWNHIAVSYGDEASLNTKVARLFLNGQLAAESIEDPLKLKGYDFNLLPYQLGYQFKGSIDELVLNEQPITNFNDWTTGRLATRFVNPKSATQATFFSEASYDPKGQVWNWNPAKPFQKSDYIPSTIPGSISSGPVDMAAAGSTGELRGDGKADLLALLPLNGIGVGSLITGIRARINGEEYAVGDGLRFGMDGKENTQAVKGLIGVTASGAKLNAGATGKELEFALMGSQADLNLYLPLDPSLAGLEVEVVAFVQSPQNRAEGGGRFNLWPFRLPSASDTSPTPTHLATLEPSESKGLLSPRYAKQVVEAAVERTEPSSLLDINTGFNTSLALTNENTLADPANQLFAEAIAAGKLANTPYVAIANPSLDGIAGIGNKRGVVWVLPFDIVKDKDAAIPKLQGLQSLVSAPEGKFDSTQLKGLVIVGRDGQQIGRSVLWADLDGDGNDELILASPTSPSDGGEGNSGQVVVISGAHINKVSKSGSKKIDLSLIDQDATMVRVFKGTDGAEFGAALAFGKVSATGIDGNALLIGAPGYQAAVSTDAFGQSIAADQRKTTAVGAVFKLDANVEMFKGFTAEPTLLLSGDLPGLANFNAGVEPTSRRFGAAISITSSERDFTGDDIADIVIGIPGLMQSRRLKGGINAKATAAQRDAELQLRFNIPDVYREGMDDAQLSDPYEKQMGGVLLIQGGKTGDQAKKVLLFGDTVFGDSAGAGSAVATGGNFSGITGTNIDDLAIGMPEVDAKTGAVSLISGDKIRGWFTEATADNYTKASMQRSAVVDAALIIPGDEANGSYGRTLNLSGDVNGDSFADLVIGDSTFMDGTGRVNVFFGSGNFGGTEKGQISGGATLYHNLKALNPNRRLDIYAGSYGEGLGRSVALLPGISNASNLLLPTSNGSSTLTTLYGKSRLKGLGSFSSRDLASSDGIEIDNLQRRTNGNASYGLLGDINGDGIADALVDVDHTPGKPSFKLSFGMGAGLSPDHQDGGTGGNSVLDLKPVLSLQHQGATNISLQNVRSAGDLNADGINDLLLSYSYDSNGRSIHTNAILLGGDLLTSNVLLQSALVSQIAPAPSVAAGSVLRSGDLLAPNEYLLSPNGHYMALMQADGDFVVQTLKPDGVNWDVSFTLRDYLGYRPFSGFVGSFGAPIANTEDSTVKLGSTAGTSLEIRNGALAFVNDRFRAGDGSKAIALTNGVVVSNGVSTSVTTESLPANAVFQDLSLTDSGVLVAKASDGTTLFSFNPSYSGAISLAAIPAARLSGLTLKVALDQALRPIATAAAGSNDGAPTLLAISEAAGSAALRTVVARARLVDVGQLFNQWLAGFTPPGNDEIELKAALAEFSTGLKNELTPFDPQALDAALVSKANLEVVAGVLEELAPNAGASFLNFVESKAPGYEQQPVNLVTSFGDAATSTVVAAVLANGQAADVLLPGQRLKPGDYLHSPNGRFMALMQADGNFVVQTLNADGVRWDVSFTLLDYRDKVFKPPVANLADASVVLGSTAGTSLEIRNGVLSFVNDRFLAADGSNAIAPANGFYKLGETKWKVTTRALPANANFQQLSLNDSGVLEAKASDGTILFSFEPSNSNSTSIIQGPIPAAKFSGLQRPTYEQLNLSNRQLILSDRDGDGSKELLIAPTKSSADQAWYSVELLDTPADSSAPWVVTRLATAPAANTSHLLWESRTDGIKPGNALTGEKAGDVQLRKINGFSQGYLVDLPVPGNAVESGGVYGVNAASLSRTMLHLHTPNKKDTWGEYSRGIGGLDLNQRLQQQGESWELKVPAYVWQMKSKGGGRPANQGGEELVLHIGSGLGSRDRIGDTNTSKIGLDGLAINFDEYDKSLRLFWNGELLWQAGPNSTVADLEVAHLLDSNKKSLTQEDLKVFMEPDRGLHNNAGITTGPELMSIIEHWGSNLFSSGVYLRYQKADKPFTEKKKNGKTTTYQGRLVIEMANAMRYVPRDGENFPTPKLNVVNKGLQIAIPIEQPLSLRGSDVVFNAYARSGSNPGVHALAGIEFNTDKPLEGVNLDRLISVGDLNGDGYEDLVGIGNLATGWNYDYKLDLPHNNLTERSISSDKTIEGTFTLTKGANGDGITRSTLIAPVILWGGSGAINLDQLTPIVRGSEARYTHASAGGLAALDNFSSANNVMVAPLGDVNGDGFDDIAISDVELGLTYILHGGTGLQSARSYLARFGAFFPETRGKDVPNASADVYLTSDANGFGTPADSTAPTAWFAGINLERSSRDVSAADPAFGGVQVTKISGITGQQLANLSGGSDFSGDGINDLFLTSQDKYEASKELSLQAPSRFVMFGGDNKRSFTHVGTTNSDSIKGTPANDVILTMAGNDIVQGLGGMDAISTGPGDDQIFLADDQFRRIDGGSDVDTLSLQGQRNQAWDFTKLASAGRIRNIEQIVATDFGANQLILNARAAAAITSGGGTLILDGDLQTEKPAVVLMRALNSKLEKLDPVSAEYDALLDVATRYSGFSFGLSDLSMLPVVVRDVQRDVIFDRLRPLTEKRPLSDLLDRLNAIDTDRKLGLGLDFLTLFAQRLAFTPTSAHAAYGAWLADLPAALPDTFALLTEQQKANLAALPQAWRATYPAYFPAGSEPVPADLGFERALATAANPAATLADAYSQWLAGTGTSSYALPAASDSSQVELLRLLNSLETLAPALIEEVTSSFDSVRLSTEFSLANADLPAGSEAFSEYVAAGGSVRLLIPEWMAVLIDPTVPTELIPTPPTKSSSSSTPGPETNLDSPLDTVSVPSTMARASTRDDLRISVGESRPSSDGRALEFTLTRSGYLSETSRVQVSTEGYVADLVASVQGQVVFAPGVVSQKVLIPLMANLPQEQQALDPYSVERIRNVSVQLNLLPDGSSGPRITSVVGLNAINAFTPELPNPSRPLTAAQLNPATLFERNVALQFPTALWLTAIANGPEEQIQFGFDNPQGQQLNDLRLIDRISGDLVSLFDAANLGAAVIYGDSSDSPSTDLFFSVEDGGRFDQDGLINSQITLAAAGALASPGSLLVGDRVLRAPSTSGMNLLLTPPVGSFNGSLAAYGELLLIATDDITGAIASADGNKLNATAGDAYLQALIDRMASAADGVRRIALNRGSTLTNLQLVNDTNYVAVLSKASQGLLPTVADLRLPSLRDTSGTSSRGIGNYQLQLDDQRLSFQLTSPYYVVPGVEGKMIALTTQLRAPSGSPVSSFHMAWLRVSEVNGELIPLLASDDLGDRLITVPPDGVVELMGGDILMPLIFQGIDPSRWAALPAGERLLQGQQGSGNWRVDIPDPSINPKPLLQRTQANAYQFGIDGNLVVRYGSELQASLASGERVLGSAGNDQFRDPGSSLGLTFVENLIISGAGNDEVAARNAAASSNNVVLTGAGDDLVSTTLRDIVYTGSGVDHIKLDAAEGNRVDGGLGNDVFQIETGGQRLLGGPGQDIFKIEGTFTSPVVIAGGSDADQFWLADAQGKLPGSTVVITDFDGEEGDRLLLPGYSFADLIFQQSGSNVVINIGNAEVALLMNRNLEMVAETSFFQFDSSEFADSRFTDFGDTPDPLATIYGDGILSVSELISDGVNGLAAFARRTFGNTNPEVAVYIHTNSGQTSVGGGRTGRKAINAIAVSDADAEWMREQIRLLDSTLGINFRFVSSSAESNLDIYYDEAISLSSDRTTLGIALANDNGRQTWWELMLNASALAGNPSGFRYTFLHELGHVFGLEHPFDNSDGDAEGQRSGQPDAGITLMSYTRPPEGFPESYQLLDWAALATIWGLDQNNTSGWRFSNSSGGDEVLTSSQALARLTAATPGDQFRGRADGLSSEISSPDPTITQQPDPTPQPQLQPIDKTVDPTATTTSTLPVLVVSEPQSSNLSKGEITWQPFWRQLDMELGVVLDADNQLQVLSAAGYGSTPSNGHQLVDLIVNGSPQADVVFASSGNTVDLGLGQDVIFSLSNTGGNNRLYGGAQTDRFVLGAKGDLIYGGMRMAGTHESITDGSNNIFVIDLDARGSTMLNDPAIEIRDFQLGRDSLTLIENDPSRSTPLPISPATYLEWREKLQDDYNVVINAAPQVRQAKRNHAITRAMLRDGFSIGGRDLFADLDSGELTLVGLDKNPSWLQLIDGKLQVAPGAAVQSGTYTFAVAGSDGMSRTPLTSFSFAVDPQVSIGSLNLAAGSALQFRFNGIGNAAVELLVQTLDANDQPLHRPRLVAGQMGRNAGLPKGIDGDLSNAVAGDLFNNGRLAFFLRKPSESAELIPLEISNEDPTAFRLSSGSIIIDAAVVATPAATPLTTFVEVGGETMLGLALPSLAPSSTDPIRKVSVSIELFREASFENTIGFYLADAVTGAVVDGRTGAFISGTPFDDQGNPSADYLITAAASGVWKGTVSNGGTTSITQSFDLHASLNLDGMVLLPFMEVNTGNERHTFMAGSSGNSDRISHITMLGNNVIGFEDQLGGGDFDHDDMVAVIRSVNML